MNSITWIGLIAGTLTTISFFPQFLKTWKTRSTKDISLEMFLLFCTGLILWIIYGVFIQNLPLIMTNVATFILAFPILVLKLKYK
ncbi:SemiSWEET transporter [Crocosphaera sp. XPORK-15E]|uniref:SemiSWEET transporter n=1 Tax=Crocosphaera sp. XPORK-15E TaxID=3110247 RepID=UPI002B1FBFB8|nr:SemiSWEET transporter [Crocosphaera sp. XPORK-15E]MEA5537223.1 SemiSWEET transporter [Crocosphaera sp. XPORK-15E]